MKIDLQMHSTFSDGHETPTELVALAASRGVTHLALTDHDTIAGVLEAQEAGERQGIVVISGIEITTAWHDKTLHILGYGFAPDDRGFLAFCKQVQDARKNLFLQKLESFNDLLRTRGLREIDVADFIRSQGAFFGLGNLLTYCTDRRIFQTKAEAARLWSETKKISMGSVEPHQAITAIHAAGGIAVLSHPFAPKISLKKFSSDTKEQDALVRELKEQGLDGIECFQPSHGAEDTERALALAQEFGLLVTGGTDWHGPIEVTGEQIRDYIPYYADAIGDIVMPAEFMQRIVERFER